MKKIMTGIALAAMFFSFSSEQEFIKQPKEKRVCPSQQQYIELKAYIVDLSNAIWSSLTDFSKDIVEIQRLALAEINGYVDSNKECFLHTATKKQRGQVHIRAQELKEELQKIQEQLVVLKQKIAYYKVAFSLN